MAIDYDHIKPARVTAAKTAHLVSVDKDAQTAVFLSSDNLSHYETSLARCDCTYFISKYDLCKHMVRLAMELGIVNSEGRTPRAQYEYDYSRLRDLIARAYGYARFFQEPVMSEDEFAQYVREYHELIAHKPDQE